MKWLNSMKFKDGDILEDDSGDTVEVIGIRNGDAWEYITKRLSDGFIDCKKEKHLSKIDED